MTDDRKALGEHLESATGERVAALESLEPAHKGAQAREPAAVLEPSVEWRPCSDTGSKRGNHGLRFKPLHYDKTLFAFSASRDHCGAFPDAVG